MTAEGWGWPGLSRRAHYFIDKTSLCGRWLFGGEIGGEYKDSNKCRACAKKLAERQTEINGQQAVIKMIRAERDE